MNERFERLAWAVLLSAATTAPAAAQTAGAKLGGLAGVQVAHRVAATVTPGAKLTVYRQEIWKTGENRTTLLLPDGTTRVETSSPRLPAQPAYMIESGATWDVPGQPAAVRARLEFRYMADGHYSEPGRNQDLLLIDVAGPGGGRQFSFSADFTCNMGIETPAPGLLKSDDRLFEILDLVNENDLTMRARRSAEVVRDDTDGAVEVAGMPELARAMHAACEVMARTHDVAYDPGALSLEEISARVNEPFVLKRLQAIAEIASRLDVLKSPFLTAAMQVEGAIGNLK